jgi:hypothetical protein
MNTIGSPIFDANKHISRKIIRDTIAINLLLKRGIWLYFFLLIFEGGLRKWFVPSLAGPLLIIRDPLVLWILATVWRRKILTMNYYVLGMVIIGIISIYTAYFLGHGNIAVALFGARILLLHFPLIFVIGKVFTYKDVLNMGRVLLMITIPMTVLITLQFYSPQTAWVNRGLGGEGGAGFSGANNFFRPPGTFSFTNGTTLFYNFAACFIIYFWFNLKAINLIILTGATFGLLIAIPFSISRGLFFQVGVSAMFAIFATALNPKYAGRMMLIISVAVGAVVLLSFTHYFQTAARAFTSRFESANKVEGGINGVFLDRFLGGMIGAISVSSKQPFFGYGVGMGTNVGSMLLSGERYFLLSEGEWGRIIGELGPVMGLAVILLRLKLAFKIIVISFKNMLQGNLMPWMLLSFGLLLLAQGGWAQPTSLGFCTLVTGLLLASLKNGVTPASPVK